MVAYFECSSCRTITPIQLIPPRCPVCGKGHGMVLSRARHETILPRPVLPVAKTAKP